MSAGAAAAAAAVMQAVRAMGVIVKVEPSAFMRIVDRHPEPLVVTAPGGFFSSKTHYLVSYKGFAFLTSSREQLQLPGKAEIVAAESMYLPG